MNYNTVHSSLRGSQDASSSGLLLLDNVDNVFLSGFCQWDHRDCDQTYQRYVELTPRRDFSGNIWLM